MYFKINLFYLSLFFTIVSLNIEGGLLSPKIIGGYVVISRERFSYQVSLRHKNNHFCGGVILDSNHILTAAHCVSQTKTDSSLTVVAGNLRLNESDENTVISNIDKITVHENYDSKSLENDIAILQLDDKYVFNDFVKPLPLWNSSLIFDINCIVSGWGSIKGGGSVSNDLMAVNINLHSISACKKAYGTSLEDGMICASAFGKDSCNGDSGGPLACDGKLTGLVSWGPKDCGNSAYPGVYTDISHYIDWIERNSSLKNIPVFSTIVLLQIIFLYCT